MQLEVKVIPKSSRNLVKDEGGHLKIYVSAPPEDNKANIAVIGLLSRYLQVPKHSIRLLKGRHSRLKIFEVTRD